jgi:hypothetical protein
VLPQRRLAGGGPGPVGAATALRAVLDDVATLTLGERAVMREWLDRVAAG